MTNRRRLVALVALAGLSLASCTDDDDDDATQHTTSSSTTTTTTEAPTTTAAVTLACGQVAFAPNSEDAASDIEATGLTCDEAKAFVELAGRETSSGGPEEVDVDGWHCERTASEEDPLPQSSYACTKGSLRVTFVRS